MDKKSLEDAAREVEQACAKLITENHTMRLEAIGCIQRTHNMIDETLKQVVELKRLFIELLREVGKNG
jgi:DnaJ-domain-containing protein 1